MKHHELESDFDSAGFDSDNESYLSDHFRSQELEYSRRIDIREPNIPSDYPHFRGYRQNVDLDWMWIRSMRSTLSHPGIKFNQSCYPFVKNAANLKLIYKRRDAEHSSYCSDPGEDTGKEEKMYTLFSLNDFQLMELKDYIDPIGKVDIDILRKLFDQTISHGYCPYEGHIKIISGELQKKYVGIPIEQICLEAFNREQPNPLNLEEYMDFYKKHRQIQIDGWIELKSIWDAGHKRAYEDSIKANHEQKIETERRKREYREKCERRKREYRQRRIAEQKLGK